jgi:Holliday junction resolvase
MPKGKINSRAKGAAAEREFATFLKESFGLSARRTAQFCGKSGDASDVVCEELPGLHIEIKRTERFNLYPAMEQAIRDSQGKKLPAVFHRQSHKDWVAVVRAEDLIKLLMVALKNDQVE